MNRHWANGFQTTFLNDLYCVQERLQAYDPTLYLMYNPSLGQWLIMDGILEIAIMKIPQKGFETLDSRIVEHIRKIHTKRGFKASYELKEADEKREREQESKLNDMAQDFAKELRPAIREAHDYGRISGINKYVRGGLHDDTAAN